MNRTRLLVGLLVAVLLGGLAANFVYRQMNQAPVVRQAAPTKIVVAAARLALGTRLRPQELQLIDWPSDEPVPGMFTRVEDCMDRALITSVEQNEPILESKLAPKEAGAGLPAAIPEGMRALSVAVNDVIGVAGFVGPGTMVDVLVTGNAPGGGGNTITKTILENIRVLAAGQKVEQDKEGKPQTVAVMTLLVTPLDADKLAMASTEGKIQLALRNTIDTKQVNPPPIFLSSLFAGAAPLTRHPAARGNPAPAPPPPVTVEVIVGSKREMKTFSNTEN